MLKKLFGLILSISVLASSFAGICPVSAAATGIDYVSINRSNGINVGNTLEAVPTFTSAADGSEAVTYQWKKIKIENKIIGKNSIEGNGGAGDFPYKDIPGANGKTYTISQDDMGYILKVEATYNGKAALSGDCVAVGSINSIYSVPALESYSFKRYYNTTTAENTYSIGELRYDEGSKAHGNILNDSNNADLRVNYAAGGSTGGYAYFGFTGGELVVTESTLAAPVELEGVLLESGYPNSYQAIPNVFVQVMYENETEYKDWGVCTDWGRTKAQAQAQQYKRYFFHYVEADAALVGEDTGKKVKSFRVIVAPQYNTDTADTVYIREISAFAKPYAAITGVNGLDKAALEGMGIIEIPTGTTAGELKNAIAVNTYTKGVKIVNSDKSTEVSDEGTLDNTMYVELTLNNSEEKTYYTITLEKPPVPVITELKLDLASFDNEACVIKNIVDGLRAGELLKAISAKDASSVKVVAFDKETVVEDDMYINETMLVELMPVMGDEAVYYTIEMAEASLTDEKLRNLALAGTILSNGAYSTSPVTGAIDGKNNTQFMSAQNKDPSNPTSSYRPYGVAPVVTLTLDAESIISKIEAYMNYKDGCLEIEYSLDQKTWKELGSTEYKETVRLDNVGALTEDVYLQVLEFAPVKARFIRATYTIDKNLALRHFNVWGVYDAPPIVTDNIAYNKSGSTSEYNVATRASNMFDLKKDTRWRSKNGEAENPWVCLDLGETKNVGSIIVYDDAEDVNYDIFSSLDSVDWSNIGKTEFGNEESAPFVKKYEGFTEARYIKLVSDKAKDISIFEFEAYKGENPNLASDDLVNGKSVSATVNPDSIENDISKVADGDDQTAFLTATGTPYKITVDLENAEEVSKIVISEPDGIYNIDAFSLRVSEDKATWHNVGTGYGIGSKKTYSFDTRKVRYIELAVASVSAVPSGISTISAYSDTAYNDEIKKAIENVDIPELITDEYELPTSYNGVVIAWQSSDESIIKVESGETVIDEPAKDTSVTLTAVFTYNNESATVTYQTTVEGSKKTSNKGSGGGGGSSGGFGGGSVFTAAAPADTYIGEAESIRDDTSLYNELNGHWGADKIKPLVEKGIIKGDNGSLQLKRTVTRAEFGAMLVRGLELDISEYNGGFEDIKASDWFAKEIRTLIDNEIMVGADGKFRPNDAITRQEMAVVASNVAKTILKLENSSDYELTFEDNEKISTWAVDAVRLAAQNEFISGFETGEFKPLENLTREQAMVVIYKLISKGGKI